MSALATCALIARVVLAAVFAVAATTKLVDRSGTRKAVIEFGSPSRVAGALSVGIPIVELAVAGLLLPASTATYGAIGALVLLGVFSAAIAWNLAGGRTPDCHCFGQLHSSPAGLTTLGRNAVLAGLAVLAIGGTIAASDASATAWTARLEGAELLALAVGAAAMVLLVAGGVAFLSLMRSYGSVLLRLERVEAALADAGIELDDELEVPAVGYEPGTRAPAFTAWTLTGGAASLETLTASGKTTVLVFTSPRCGPCRTLLPTASS